MLLPDSMYFLIPGMDDGDNPHSFAPAETELLPPPASCSRPPLILHANCRRQALCTLSRVADGFSLKVELKSGDRHFEYSVSDLPVHSRFSRFMEFPQNHAALQPQLVSRI